YAQCHDVYSAHPFALSSSSFPPSAPTPLRTRYSSRFLSSSKVVVRSEQTCVHCSARLSACPVVIQWRCWTHFWLGGTERHWQSSDSSEEQWTRPGKT